MAKSEYILLFQEVEEVTRKLTDEQFGALMRAAFAYRFRGEVYNGSDIRVDQAFESISNQIDRDIKLREKKAKAGQLRWAQEESNAEQAEAPLSTPEHTQQSEAPYQSIPVQSIPVQSIPVQSSEKEKKDNKRSKTRTYTQGAAAPAHTHEKSFGKYSWVKLSLPEHEALQRELGEAELERCIAYLDESAQMTGNKNRWKDWGTVIRRCSREGWGKQPSRDTPMGASGQLGEAELRNVRRAMREERTPPIYGVVV